MHEKKEEESKEIEEIEKIMDVSMEKKNHSWVNSYAAKVVFVNCISEYPLP